MQQHHHRPVSRTFINDIEDELTAAVLIHAHSMDPPARGVRHFTDFAATRYGVLAAQTDFRVLGRLRSRAL